MCEPGWSTADSNPNPNPDPDPLTLTLTLTLTLSLAPTLTRSTADCGAMACEDGCTGHGTCQLDGAGVPGCRQLPPLHLSPPATHALGRTRTRSLSLTRTLTLTPTLKPNPNPDPDPDPQP